MARAALIQSHCRRMNTVSERLPERLGKTVRGRALRAKRESDREFHPLVGERGKREGVNMHEGKSNCVKRTERVGVDRIEL